MFLYRYNVTCKTSSLSSIFSIKNITAFLLTAGIFSLIQAVLFYYSAVDPKVGYTFQLLIPNAFNLASNWTFESHERPYGHGHCIAFWRTPAARRRSIINLSHSSIGRTSSKRWTSTTNNFRTIREYCFFKTN